MEDISAMTLQEAEITNNHQIRREERQLRYILGEFSPLQNTVGCRFTQDEALASFGRAVEIEKSAKGHSKRGKHFAANALPKLEDQIATLTLNQAGPDDIVYDGSANRARYFVDLREQSATAGHGASATDTAEDDAPADFDMKFEALISRLDTAHALTSIDHADELEQLLSMVDDLGASEDSIQALIDLEKLHREPTEAETLHTEVAAKLNDKETIPAESGDVATAIVDPQRIEINGKGYVIGDNNSPCKLYLIELELGMLPKSLERSDYQRIHESYFGRSQVKPQNVLTRGMKALAPAQFEQDLDPMSHETQMEMRTELEQTRCLQMATASALLPKMLETKQVIDSKNPQPWFYDHEDAGFARFFYATATHTSPPPEWREEKIEILAVSSVKLRYLTGLLLRTCVEKGQKMIICIEWPATMFMVSTYCTLCGFSVRNIRYGMSDAEKRETIELFNRKDDDTCQILVINSKTFLSSTNIQLSGCATMVIMDMINMGLILQLARRIRRSGVEMIQDVYILCAVRTMDQVYLAKYSGRFIAELAGTGDQTVTPEMLRDLDEDPMFSDYAEELQEDGGLDLVSARKSAALVRQASIAFQQIFHTRSPRNTKAYADENFIDHFLWAVPAERKHFETLGGVYTNLLCLIEENLDDSVIDSDDDADMEDDENESSKTLTHTNGDSAAYGDDLHTGEAERMRMRMENRLIKERMKFLRH